MASKETGQPLGQSEEKVRSNRTTGCWSSSSSAGDRGAAIGREHRERGREEGETAGGTGCRGITASGGRSDPREAREEGGMVRGTGHPLLERRVPAPHGEPQRSR